MQVHLIVRIDASTGKINHVSRHAFTSPARAASEVEDYNRMDSVDNIHDGRWATHLVNIDTSDVADTLKHTLKQSKAEELIAATLSKCG